MFGRGAQVASFMRAVCRTLQQCHLRNILHRDIKPGNFMLLSDDEGAPLKAIGAPQHWPPIMMTRHPAGEPASTRTQGPVISH